MQFELVSTKSDREGEFKLQMLALMSDMEQYASSILDHKPEVGEEFTLGTSWPTRKDGLSATREDYEKYGTSEAHGVFRRVS